MAEQRQLDVVKTRKQLDNLAWLLDNYFKIPGTNWRFGLEAIIGLVPGAGDAISAILALFLLVRAFQFKLPKIVIVRMLLNSVLDFSLGAIPLIGDAFDFFYKANTRNMKLFHQYAEEPLGSTRRHWIFIVGLIAGFLGFVFVVIVVVLYVIWRLLILR